MASITKEAAKAVTKQDTTTATIGKRGMAVIARLREIAVIKKAARDVDDEGKALQAELFTITGGTKFGTFQGVTAITRTDSHSIKVDLDALLQGWPEAYAAVVTKEPYSYYRL